MAHVTFQVCIFIVKEKALLVCLLLALKCASSTFIIFIGTYISFLVDSHIHMGRSRAKLSALISYVTLQVCLFIVKEKAPLVCLLFLLKCE